LKFIAKTLYGLESVLAAELEELGANKIKPLNRAVEFEGSTHLLYKANLMCRTALRILIPITSFKAHNDRHLYALSSKVKWTDYLSLDTTFAIDSTTHSDRFRHSRYAALKLKDAIVDQFRKEFNERPSIDSRTPDVRINLHIADTDVSISLDSSGESLEKRGYRTESNEAPMSEVLAAGLIKLSGWDKKKDFLDPMTGSGTIAIEAAMMNQNIPPGLHRDFAFQNWMDYNKELFEEIEMEVRSNIVSPSARIVARDINKRSLPIAKRNAMRAGVVEHIQWETADFCDSEPFSDSAHIIMNPPYGERLEEHDDMLELYDAIGFRLKHHYPNHTVWVITSNLAAMKKLGLKPDHRIKLYNGSLECRFNGYTLFKGKRIDQLKA